VRKTRNDHSGAPKRRLPPVPKEDLILYHWSPTANREKIKHDGLKPGSKSLDGLWKPPYICFSADPSLAWQLSGRMYPEIELWDLWACNMDHQDSFDHYEIITDTYIETGRSFIKEYRIYTRIYKRDLDYIATRRQDGT
jgi:hypothetical protein